MRIQSPLMAVEVNGVPSSHTSMTLPLGEERTSARLRRRRVLGSVAVSREGCALRIAADTCFLGSAVFDPAVTAPRAGGASVPGGSFVR
jgi:hypothetical protein